MLWDFTIYSEVEFLFPGEIGGELEVITFEEAKEKGAGEFCLRLLMCQIRRLVDVFGFPHIQRPKGTSLGGLEMETMPTWCHTPRSRYLCQFPLLGFWFILRFGLCLYIALERTGDRGLAQQGPCWTRGICPLLPSRTGLWPWCASLD